MKILKKLNAIQTIALGFAAIIVIGALLLMLPIANKTGESIPFINALFSAGSATCVTGLVVYDTFTQFTYFGQAVIIVLIQIGGLGFVTVAVLLSFVLKKRIGLKERMVLSEAMSLGQVGGVVKLVKRVLIGTAIIEGGGAVLLYTRFISVVGPVKAIWFSIFHSISAFCNAGFDLMGYYEPFSSLVYFQNDVFVNIVVMFLILSGGIGFLVWSDMVDYGFKLKKYCLHSKIMLVSTLVLVFGGAVIFFFTEKGTSMEGMNIGQRVLASFFQSVTPRTAGMNTIDLTKLSQAGVLVTVLFMFIGAGAGSTGGGIKVTTVFTAGLAVKAYATGQNDANIFGRRLEDKTVHRALCTVFFYLALAVLATIIIQANQSFKLTDTLIEVFSAIGTVGLSTGITRELNVLSKIVLILLMYIGRIGSMTAILSVAERAESGLQKPVGKIIIG